MNLLLLEQDELEDGCVILRDERAQHLRTTLRVTPGQSLRAGIVRGPVGTASVLDVGDNVRIRFAPTSAPSTPCRLAITLAVPRPKVLARVLEHLASFAVDEIRLINAWRVDKSYFGSPLLAPDTMRAALLRGAAQGETTWLPRVIVHDRFMSYMEARPHVPGLLLHARGGRDIETIEGSLGAQMELAIGPEGGWIDREIETFVQAGFAPVHLGLPILRVEAALAAAIGQVAMLRRMRGPTAASHV